MPEINECRCSAELVHSFIADVKEKFPPPQAGKPFEELRLLNLWSDPTKAEAERSRDRRIRAGHVYVLKPSARIRRGPNKAQTPVYPDRDILGHKGKTHVNKQHIFLDDAKATPRDVMLKFVDIFGAPIWCQVKLFTHTMAQVYTRAQWDLAITKIPKSARKFVVGLAFEFRNHVLAFVCKDLLIQIHWSLKYSDLPGSDEVDIYSEPLRFLAKVVSIIEERRESSSNNLAVVALREIFDGCGAYTVCEVFHRAGLPVHLTEKEVFDSPSRAARLVMAYYHIAAEGAEIIVPWFHNYMYYFVVAADKFHRHDYSTFLKVYGQDRTWITRRQKSLIQMLLEHKGNFETDPFEPALVSRGLGFTGWHIGQLVFGRGHWQAFIAANPELREQWAGHDLDTGTDPLTAYYTAREANADTTSTHLDLTRYRYLMEPGDTEKGAHLTTYLYRQDSAGAPKDHDVWSVYPILQDDDSIEEDFKDDGLQRFFVEEEALRQRALLKTVIGCTNKWTVGPLDFCGVARIVPAQGGGDPQVHVCEEDPRFGEYYERKRAASHKSSSAASKTGRRLRGKTCQRRRINQLPRAAAIAAKESKAKCATRAAATAAATAAKESKAKCATTLTESGEPKRKRRKRMTEVERTLKDADAYASTFGNR